MPHDPKVVANCPVLQGTTVIGEADQVNVSDAKRLVRRRRTRWKTALMGAVHRQVRGGHVAVNEDVVDLP